MWEIQGFPPPQTYPEVDLVYLKVILFPWPVINSGLVIWKILVAYEKLTVSEKVAPGYSETFRN